MSNQLSVWHLALMLMPKPYDEIRAGSASSQCLLLGRQGRFQHPTDFVTVLVLVCLQAFQIAHRKPRNQQNNWKCCHTWYKAIYSQYHSNHLLKRVKVFLCNPFWATCGSVPTSFGKLDLWKGMIHVCLLWTGNQTPCDTENVCIEWKKTRIQLSAIGINNLETI